MWSGVGKLNKTDSRDNKLTGALWDLQRRRASGFRQTERFLTGKKGTTRRCIEPKWTPDSWILDMDISISVSIHHKSEVASVKFTAAFVFSAACRSSFHCCCFFVYLNSFYDFMTWKKIFLACDTKVKRWLMIAWGVWTTICTRPASGMRSEGAQWVCFTLPRSDFPRRRGR